MCAGHHHAVTHIGTGLNGHIGGDHAVIHIALDLAALADGAVLHHRAFTDVVGRRHGVAAVNTPAFVGQIQIYIGIDNIQVGLPQTVNGAHIFPVAGEGIGKQPLAGVQHGGDDVLAEVVFGIGIGLILGEIAAQGLPGEDVNSHGGHVGRVGVCLVQLQVLAQLAPAEYIHAHRGFVALGLGRLLGKFVNTVVLVGSQNTKTGGLLPRHLQHSDGTVRIVLFVEVDHLGVVHLVDVVTGEHHYIFRVVLLNKIDVLVNGVRRALIPLGAADGLIRGENMYAAVLAVQVPGLTVAQIVVQFQRLILGQYANGVNTAVDAVG